ncbi:MAG TPA: hypothetical protein VIK18_20150, partial [Pirellulales bacterium]
MDRYRLPALAVTCFVCLATTARAQTESDAFKNKLAIQTAMLQAQDLLRTKQAAKAVAVLEEQLSRIDGNRSYLMLLRDAYRSYITQLALGNQEALAQKYVERLRILDPHAAAEMTSRPTTPSVPAAASRPQSPVLAALAVGAATTTPRTAQGGNAATAVRPTITARGKMEEETPKQKLAHELLVRAEAEFGEKHYGPARLLFEQAYQADQSVTEGSRDRWAYCKLNHVVEELNRNPAGGPLPDLEREVQVAIALAPQ